MILPWAVDRVAGPAAALHAESAALLAAPARPRRLVRVLDATDVAVVLGSTQPERHVDPVRMARAGISMTRRRSGGGAVLVGPGLVVWVDVVVPAHDPLWEDDVGRASWWLGQAWAGALADVGLPGGHVWRGGLVRSRWSDRICFAGTGSGEVLLDGAKAVGMSQRRTRVGALFQCAAPVVWQPAVLLDVLALDEAEREAARAALTAAAVGIGTDAAGRLVPALLDRLP